MILGSDQPGLVTKSYSHNQVVLYQKQWLPSWKFLRIDISFYQVNKLSNPHIVACFLNHTVSMLMASRERCICIMPLWVQEIYGDEDRRARLSLPLELGNQFWLWLAGLSGPITLRTTVQAACVHWPQCCLVQHYIYCTQARCTARVPVSV